MNTVIRDASFQATDLSRRHREVLDAARHGSAVIRDKDGLTLIVEPASNASRRAQMVEWLLSAVRIDRALRLPVSQRTSWEFGSLAWVADLDPEDQRAFLDGFLSLLMKNVDADYSEEIENHLADWRATAQAWGDQETRESLLESSDTPLHGVEL